MLSIMHMNEVGAELLQHSARNRCCEGGIVFIFLTHGDVVHHAENCIAPEC